MYIVGVRMTLDASPPASADDVTDLIELLCDALDAAGLVPSVRTSGVGDAVELAVDVLGADPSELDALLGGLTAIREALAHADVGGFGEPTRVTSTVRALEPA